MVDKTKLSLSRRQLLGGLGAVGAVSAAAGLGTAALVSDEEELTNNQVEASELDLIIDSFATGDFSEYTHNTGDWAINSTFATDGTNGLEYSGDTLTSDTLSDEPKSGLSSSIVSRTGLNAYPSQGDEFHIDHEYSFGGVAADTLTMRFFFAFQDRANMYYVQIRYNADSVELVKGDGFLFNGGNGFNTLLKVPLSAVPENTDLRLEVTWDDGTLGGSPGDITLEVFDASTETSLGSGTTNDTTYTSGGIGMRGRLYDTNHRISQDNWRVLQDEWGTDTPTATPTPGYEYGEGETLVSNEQNCSGPGGGENEAENENEDEGASGGDYIYTHTYDYQYTKGDYKLDYRYEYEWSEDAKQNPDPPAPTVDESLSCSEDGAGIGPNPDPSPSP